MLLSTCIDELEHVLSELEQLASQTAVHRKKFEFSVSQVRRFVNALNNLQDITLTDTQERAYRETQEQLHELYQLLCSHQNHNWAQPTLENKSSYVPSTLTGMACRLHELAKRIDPEAASMINGDSQQWLQYHILDLRGIQASFKQYLACQVPNDPVVPLMTERLKSVDEFIAKYKKETFPNGIRIFSPIPVHYQQWRLVPEDFQEVKEIGSGISAVVYYGYDKRNGHEVAIKKLKFKKLSGTKLSAFQREVSVLATSIHPCLLKFVGATDSPPFCIITEWMSGGTLYQELQKYKKLNATMKTIAAFDIARGMQYLHGHHIMHRDLKSLNVLLDENGYAKICDFGFSRYAEAEETMLTTNVGTPHWMAPEMLASSPAYNFKVDVYAYGIVLWEIVTGQIPYQGLEAAQITGQVLSKDLRPPLPDYVSQDLQDLISFCWSRDPERRPTFDEVVSQFVAGKILLPEADKEQVMRYIQDTLGSTTIAAQELEFKLDSGELANESKLQELLNTLEKNGIPPNLVQKCWRVVEENKTVSPTTIGRAISLFLNTQLKSKAAALLRSLPCNSVPQSMMEKAIEMIPTGSEEFDRDIIITACKNGCADLAVVGALLPLHLKLALEVVAQHGVDVRLKAAVADRCVQCLTSPDVGLVCAAVRCLVGIKESRRISLNVLQQMIQNNSSCMRNCAFVALTVVAKSGIQIPNVILDSIMNSFNSEPLARNVILFACTNVNSAIHIVNRIAYGDESDIEFVFKVMLLSAKHAELRPAVMVALVSPHVSAIKVKYPAEFRTLQSFVNQ